MNTGRRSAGRVAFILIGFICSLAAHPAPGAINGHATIPSPTDSLNSRIAELRCAGRYEEALQVVRRLLDAQTGRATPAWRVADTLRLVTTLQAIVTMPSPAREALSEADRLTDAIDTHYEKGDFEVAAAEAERQAALRREYLGSRHPELVESLVSCAFAQWRMGNHSVAERAASEALTIAQSIDPDDPRTGECLNVLGLACMASGKLDEAEEHYRRALGIFREHAGEESLEYTMVFENLGALCGERVEWALTEPYYQKCLSVNRRLLGPNHADVARSLHNLGSCYVAQRDVLRARPLLEEALEIRKRVLGARHPDVALTMHILSDAYGILGDFDRARQLLEDALAIRAERLRPDHPQIAWNLYALSSVDLTLGDYESACRRGEQALAIWANSDETMQYARGLWQMGTLAWLRGDWAAVESYDREVLEILSGCDCGEYSHVLQRNAALLAYRGQHAEAESVLVVAAGVFEDLRRTAATVEQRGWARVANPYRLLAAERLRRGENEDAWPALERWLARALIDQLAVVNGATDGWVYTLSRIQGALGEDEAIVGWLDIVGVPGPEAWGYVIRNLGPVHWAALPAEETRAYRPAGEGQKYRGYAVSEHAKQMRDGLRYAAAWPARVSRDDRLDAHARALWHERIEPVSPYLQGVEHLIVIPSRVMMGVPVEAMIDPSGARLLDRFRVSYVSSGTVLRWLVDRRRGSAGVASALLVGDPAFGPGPAVRPGDENPRRETTHVADDSPAVSSFEVTVLRSALAGNRDALRALPPLEQSRNEIDAIAGLVGDATVLVGSAASERNLEQLAQSGLLADFDVLHFATHAIVDEHVPGMSALVLSQPDWSEVGQGFENEGSADDGLLSVHEISRQWSLQARLVTLSACRTALGPVSAGEGYLGFAQAFLRAGAQSVIVSLWDVDDTATSLLMTRFYQNLTGHPDGAQGGGVQEPMSSAEALREAKQWLRHYNPSHDVPPFAHLSYWSAFVLIGDAN